MGTRLKSKVFTLEKLCPKSLVPSPMSLVPSLWSLVLEDPTYQILVSLLYLEALEKFAMVGLVDGVGLVVETSF